MARGTLGLIVKERDLWPLVPDGHRPANGYRIHNLYINVKFAANTGGHRPRYAAPIHSRRAGGMGVHGLDWTPRPPIYNKALKTRPQKSKCCTAQYVQFPQALDRRVF